MTFGNRFVAERCGNVAARVARTTEPPGAPFAVNLTTAPTCRPSLIKSPPPASNEALRTKGFDGGCGPLQAGGPLFPDA
jgi:hypothetical protein